MLLVLLIGIVIGRNYHAIYNQAKKDTRQVLWALYQSPVQTAAARILARVFGVLDSRAAYYRAKRQANYKPTHSIICDCGKRSCLGRTLAINTYVRRIMSS